MNRFDCKVIYHDSSINTEKLEMPLKVIPVIKTIASLNVR